MTDSFDDLERVWRAADPGGPGPLTPDRVQELVDRRRVALREALARRLRKELGVYALLTLIMMVAVAGHPGRLAGLVILAGVLLSAAALFGLAGRALRRVSLGGSLAASLAGMIAVLERVMRIYLAGYVTAILAGTTVLVLVAAGTLGAGALWWTLTAAAAAFVAWSWRSGRRYLDREFGGHRRELQAALDDLRAA